MSSVSPEIKYFRWILSHLTIIVVLSVIVYVYWSQYGFWSDDHAAPTLNPLVKSSEQQLDGLGNKESSDNIAERVSDNNVLEKEVIEINTLGSQTIKSSYPSSDFSKSPQPINMPAVVLQTSSPANKTVDRLMFEKRMREYQQNLSAEDQKVMDNAGKIFHQESKKVVRYPTDNDIEVIEKSNIAVTEDMSLISHLPPDEAQEKSTEAVRIREVNIPVELKTEANLSAEAETIVLTEAEAPSETRAGIEADKQHNKPLVVQKKGASAQDKKLQQQIRDRQKQLQEQMVLLIPLNLEKKTDTDTITNKRNTNFKSIKPLINTSEQKQLLNEARQAFDLREFKIAEEKYLQLIKQLPELPDIVGELASVYRTQNKTPDYLVTNTQFVKHLVNHNRFDEAWKVVKETDKIDKKIANKQRRIINKKQKDL